MKNAILFLFVVLQFVFTGCSDNSHEAKSVVLESTETVLPFKFLDLKDMSNFKKTTKNWSIMGNASVDRAREKMLTGANGTDILINLPQEIEKNDLFTNFEHGDIELELDVMMPVNSDSGLFFQGRYEVQLFDSWGTQNPTFSDIGGIYQKWVDTDKKAQEGYAPTMNAAKTPGLWQHVKIIFHAPKFDDKGNKVQDARFGEVRINGQLVQKDISLTDPTPAAAFKDEKPLGPLMIQGDQGPVAFKNIKYKLYRANKVKIENLRISEYDNTSQTIPNLDSLKSIHTVKTDSISALMATGEGLQKLLVFTGEFLIPENGDYIFDFRVNRGGGVLLINKDTIIDLDGDYAPNEPRFATVSLVNGKVPFTLIYNKHRPRTQGFSLAVEGPGMQKHSLQAKGSWDSNIGSPSKNIMVSVSDVPITLRSYFMHRDTKRTHVISTGMPQGISFAYDLAMGSLLKVWSGDFLNTTQMWYSRGIEQLAVPAEFNVSMHGAPDFIFLTDDKQAWPDSIPEGMAQKQLGYEFDASDIPTFSHKIHGSVITDRFIPLKTERGIQRTTTVSGTEKIWHKIAEGRKIELLNDGAYIIDDAGYFVEFSEGETPQPILRHMNGKDELLLKIDAGKHSINYSIIW